MLNRPAFFALLAAAGIAAAGYGCDLEDREAPKPNPKPIGGTPAAQGAGSGGTGANGGGGSSGEGTGSTTTGGDGGGGGEGGSGGGPGLAAQLFPFCGCLENGSDSGECFDCLWSSQINGCVQEGLNCDQSANCIELQQFFQDGLCQDVTPMCIESAIQGLEPGVGALAVYLECACTVCADLCPASTCQ